MARERTERASERSSQEGHAGPALNQVTVNLDLSRTTFQGRGQGSHSSYLARVASARARLATRDQPLLPFERPSGPGEPAATSTPAQQPDVLSSSPLSPSTVEPLLPSDEAVSESRDLANARPTLSDPERTSTISPPEVATGEKAKARDILAAIRTLKRIEEERRPATTDERDILRRFGGFGAVALSLFPDPVKGTYKDPTWQALGEMLSRRFLRPRSMRVRNGRRSTPSTRRPLSFGRCTRHSPASACRTMPPCLEPGCGIGNFMGQAPAGMRFIGVELDSISGRIARALYPDHDIRIESFADTKLPEGSIDAVIGNPPFADVRLDYRGQRFSLHDFFFAKSIDALKPGGVLALVTSHFTLDKQNAATREYLAERADFLGAIRLPSDAFKHEGTRVVTDIVFLRRRATGRAANHVDPAWCEVEPVDIDGARDPHQPLLR